jgi:hypothetical protein
MTNGMTRALVVLSLLAILAAGCGDDEGGGGSGSSTPEPAATSEGPSAKGTGYTLQPPEGFRDLKDRFKDSAVKVDLAYADESASGFATNVVVIREGAGGAGLDDVMETFKGQAEAQADDAGISAIEDRELDGVPAKTYSFMRREEANGKVRQRQVVAVKDDAIYTLTWSVAADGFEAQEATLDAMLDSWRWS